MKMWVRKSGDARWEVGCQECGRLVHEDWAWDWALTTAWWHIDAHQRGLA